VIGKEQLCGVFQQLQIHLDLLASCFRSGELSVPDHRHFASSAQSIVAD
jgi:hypothetical protein